LSRKVYIQGSEYSFHYQAAGELGVPKYMREPVATHGLLFAMLRGESNGRAVVAVHNTTKGIIQGSHEQVQAGRDIGRIIGRTDLDIELPLYGLPRTRLEDITHIHTQRHAMEQCLKTLAALDGNVFWVSETDTALSATSVLELGKRTHAAITPHAAGSAAGLQCLSPNMRDNKDLNVTTFYMLGKGEYDNVPEGEGVITVAALDRTGGERSSDRLREFIDDIGRVSLLNAGDIDSTNFIVEMDAGGDHAGAIYDARSGLQGAYDVRFLGGYVQQTAAPASTSLVAA
jgi:prephenate dehydratase